MTLVVARWAPFAAAAYRGIVRFGIFDQSEQPGGLALGALYESRLALAERAEALGFWSYHKSEHHMIPLDHAPDPSVFLAALSQRTTRIRLCSLVHILPFHHPLRLAEQLCMLDHLSGGRLEIGFGKGVSAPEHQLWGLDPDAASACTDEHIRLLLEIFHADDRLDFEGEFHRFRDVPIELHPMQLPHPPLWRPGRLETAAELGVSTVVGGPTVHVHRSIERYRELLQPGIGGGHRPALAAVRKFVVAPTDAEAESIGRRAWTIYTHNLGLLFRRYEVAIPNDPTIGGDFDAARSVNAVVVGSPERVRDHVRELGGDGIVDHLIGGFAFGDLSHDEALRSIELFADAVAPMIESPPHPSTGSDLSR